MEQHHDLNTMLHMLKQPAFLVEQGLIKSVNPAAAAWFVQPGQSFPALLVTGGEEYENFTEGSLFVTLSIAGTTRDALVTRMESGDLVTTELAQYQQTLQLLGLVATTLRQQVSNLMATAEQFLPTATGENEDLQIQAAKMNQQLYQLLRFIGNMNHAAEFALTGSMESEEVCGFVKEILDKAMAQTPRLDSRITYELPKDTIFTQVDRENLERAVLNLLSNAIKHSPENTPVRVRMMKKHQRLFISFSNTLADPDNWVAPHTIFLREPSLEDPRRILGLGMLLVQNVAAEHGGALLVERTEDTVRYTLTLSITRSDNPQVRSPICTFDYAGEYDHCLVELADVLPAELYRPENLK